MICRVSCIGALICGLPHVLLLVFDPQHLLGSNSAHREGQEVLIGLTPNMNFNERAIEPLRNINTYK